MNQGSAQKKTICLQLDHIKKDYYIEGKPFTAIKDFSCCFAKTGFTAILGHSGSGKTTLLNIIGGLDHYTEGDLIIDGRSTKDYKDKDWDNYRNRRIGFVFQSYNLISHLNLIQNVELSLRLGGMSRKKREGKAREVLEKVGLGDSIKKYPNQLSGGQMQRVAIARALVNDPDIILADEPTGALDSKTSEQVIDLIKEVGKDRCVILVTHNQEIAQKYADRIIEMKDGEILSDSNPISIEECETVDREVGKKTSMSFGTAILSSLRNIATKKGRTAATAISCSFGIIGVALILATTNGFTNYVGNVEMSVANSIPISISPITYKTTSTISEDYEKYPDDKTVHVYEASSSVLTPVYNNFSTEYFEYLNRMMDDPTCPAYGAAMSILYNRNGLNFHFIANAVDGIREIDQYRSAGSLGSAISSVTNLPATIIHELYGDEDKMSSLYDTIDGRFPSEPDEMALILDRYNRIDFSTMKALGYYASSDNYKILSDEEKHISFSDILYKNEENPGKIRFKCYKNSDYYQLGSSIQEMRDSGKLRTWFIDSYENFRFVNGELTADPATAQFYDIARPNSTNVYNDDATYKPFKMKIVGILRPTPSSYLQLMPTSLAYTPKLAQIMAGDVAEGTVGHEFGQIQKDNWVIFRDNSAEKTNDGLEKLKAVFNAATSLIVEGDDASVATAYSALASSLPNAIYYLSVCGYENAAARFTSVSGFLGHCRNFGAEFNKISSYQNLITKALFNVNSFLDRETPENIVDLIAYANSYAIVSSILIFPNSLTTKEAIHNYLDAWNNSHPNDGITYSDIVSDVTGGLGTLISVISAVLIVFASISLVVACVMTAIITYVSVIERTKEIGVLRACGARKKDVSLLFEAECVIVGAIAGVLGIVVTLLACIPINLALDAAFPGNNLNSIASLSPWHALVLLAISIVLALISGFIPARVAAKKDPVVCLRSE